jgi:uncharacterized protein (TIGR01370 family)
MPLKALHMPCYLAQNEIPMIFIVKTAFRNHWCWFTNYSILFLILLTHTLSAADTKKNWAIYYGYDVNVVEELLPFNLVVLDNERHPSLEGLREDTITTLAYLSLVEVQKHRRYYEKVKKLGLLLDETYNSNPVIDIRNKLWAKLIIEEIIPSILYQRFDGIFLDTLDDAENLENKDPVKYKGFKKAAEQLVKAIRLNYPTSKIMMNRALYLLPQMAQDIDMEVLESIYTTYDPVDKSYLFVPEEHYKSIIDMLHRIQEQNPKLEIFTLDYWYRNDPEKIKEIYRTQRKQGFVPYVTTIELDTITLEPK